MLKVLHKKQFPYFYRAVIQTASKVERVESMERVEAAVAAAGTTANYMNVRSAPQNGCYGYAWSENKAQG